MAAGQQLYNCCGTPLLKTHIDVSKRGLNGPVTVLKGKIPIFSVAKILWGNSFVILVERWLV